MDGNAEPARRGAARARSTVSCEERGRGSKDKKRLRAEQRKAEAAVVRAHQPEDFGAWLHRKAERDEAALERLAALYQQRGNTVERKYELLPKKAPARAIDPADDARIVAAHRGKVEMKKVVGIEPEPPARKKSRGRRM